MSWQSYVDDHLLCDLPGGGQLSAAAILGEDGGVWAQSENFPTVSEEQVAAINKGFEKQENLAQSGLKLGDVKYMVIAGDEGVLRGRKGAGGICLKKTTTAMVIGIYQEGTQPGDVNMVVENLGDYLIGQGI